MNAVKSKVVESVPVSLEKTEELTTCSLRRIEYSLEFNKPSAKKGILGEVNETSSLLEGEVMAAGPRGTAFSPEMKKQNWPGA